MEMTMNLGKARTSSELAGSVLMLGGHTDAKGSDEYTWPNASWRRGNRTVASPATAEPGQRCRYATLAPDPCVVAKGFETRARSIVAPVKIFASG
jgi:hypothetical protein